MWLSHNSHHDKPRDKTYFHFVGCPFNILYKQGVVLLVYTYTVIHIFYNKYNVSYLTYLYIFKFRKKKLGNLIAYFPPQRPCIPLSVYRKSMNNFPVCFKRDSSIVGGNLLLIWIWYEYQIFIYNF